jgi:hypothetical protein
MLFVFGLTHIKSLNSSCRGNMQCPSPDFGDLLE